MADGDLPTLENIQFQMPLDFAAVKQVGRKLWRKQVLPYGKVRYRGQILDFTKDFAAKLVANFNAGAFDQVPFFLADRNNEHNSDPERVRGEVKGLEAGQDGLYATIETNDEGTAHLTDRNPSLGTSVRVLWDYTRGDDGKHFGPVLEHIAGTTKPHAHGLKPWMEMSAENEQVEDLSYLEFSAPNKTDPEEGDSHVDNDPEPKKETVEMAEHGLTEGDTVTFKWKGKTVTGEVKSIDDSGDAPVAVVEVDGEEHRVPANTLKKKGGDKDMAENGQNEKVDLTQLPEEAQDYIRNLQSKADMAESADKRSRMLESTLREERINAELDGFSSRGVPAAVVNLARPMFLDDSAAEEVVVDMSENGEEVKKSRAQIMREVLKQCEGMVDMSGERGDGSAHSETTNEEEEDLINRYNAAIGRE